MGDFVQENGDFRLIDLLSALEYSYFQPIELLNIQCRRIVLTNSTLLPDYNRYPAEKIKPVV